MVVSENVQSHSEIYIVHVELHADTHFSTSSLSREDLESWYRSFLPTVTTASSNEAQTLIYSYHNVFKGFAAKLSSEQVKEMEKKQGFLSAQPQQVLSLHTTHSQTFLGLQQNTGFWKQSNYGRGVIIGVLDSGVNPDHPSFSDAGMPPPPAKWKGKCQFNSPTACNNKLIGARFFENGNGSPMDEDGHGTHTASTAAGNFVKGANVFGNAQGTAVGVAPLAHLAIYKVCSPSCSESDILAAMDVAIDDGVDILSLSLGGPSMPFHLDNIALGAYSAMEKGIFVSCAAGNNGPSRSTMSNEAPWILTVGASTIDRTIRTTAVLGNKVELLGESLYQPKDFPPKKFHLAYPGINTNDTNLQYCPIESMNSTQLRGKIVVCINGDGISRIRKGEHVKGAGAVGMILINEEAQGYTTSADAHVLPATHLSYVDGLKVQSYIFNSKSATASISFKGTVKGNDQYAPVVAAFSSRGPSQASPGILKPDVIGPGVNILAAWPFSVEKNSNTKSNFNIISGTSMACPHLSGIAALLKSVHPNWSPATIKSAIMTTADELNHANKDTIVDESLLPANPFAMGSGHVNPTKVSNPGLVYDLKPKDYIPYLCGLNYTATEMSKITQQKVSCRSSIPEAQLNYPSFSITFGSTVQTYTRIVTNVGTASSSYTVQVVPPPGVGVKLNPNILRFTRLNQKLTYKVTFRRLTNGTVDSENAISHGYLKWISANHSVRSPIVAIMSEAIELE